MLRHALSRIIFSIVLVAASLAPPAGASDAPRGALDLPAPGGRHSVGIRSLVLSDRGRGRDLIVTLWYPAAAGARGPAAPYMDRTTAAAVAKEWSPQPDFAPRVRPHAVASAPVAAGGPFPIVLLEHGSGTVPAGYTLLAEGLAGAGFVVAATNHPPDSLISAYPDGRVLRFAPYWPADADRRTQGITIGRFAADVLEKDARFVLDRLAALSREDAVWRGRLDPARAGIVGHSMGGTTAALTLRDDPRILAGVNLDGSTYPGMNADVRPVQLGKPFLCLLTEEHASDPGDHGHEFAGKDGDSYYVVVPGADHMSFTDARLLGARFGAESPPDDAAFGRALLAAEATRTLVEAFLAKYLQGRPAPILDVALQIEKK